MPLSFAPLLAHLHHHTRWRCESHSEAIDRARVRHVDFGVGGAGARGRLYQGSQKKALSSVDGNSLLVIGAGFCLTEAFTSTNASKVIVNLLAGAHYSFVVDLFLLYIFTCALANLIHPGMQGKHEA